MAFFLFIDLVISIIFLIIYAVRGVIPVWLAVVGSIVGVLVFFGYLIFGDN